MELYNVTFRAKGTQQTVLCIVDAEDEPSARTKADRMAKGFSCEMEVVSVTGPNNTAGKPMTIIYHDDDLYI